MFIALEQGNQQSCNFIALSAFKALSAFMALLFYSGRFYFFCIAPFCSCIALYSDSLGESARYFTFLPNCHVAIISISWCEVLYLLISE
jgi:hypothetical protein